MRLASKPRNIVYRSNIVTKSIIVIIPYARLGSRWSCTMYCVWIHNMIYYNFKILAGYGGQGVEFSGTRCEVWTRRGHDPVDSRVHIWNWLDLQLREVRLELGSHVSEISSLASDFNTPSTYLSVNFLATNVFDVLARKLVNLFHPICLEAGQRGSKRALSWRTFNAGATKLPSLKPWMVVWTVDAKVWCTGKTSHGLGDLDTFGKWVGCGENGWKNDKGCELKSF